MILRANAAPAGVIATIIAINFAWVAASLFVAFGPMFAPTLLGKVFVCRAGGDGVLFAELQIIGLRRARAMA